MKTLNFLLVGFSGKEEPIDEIFEIVNKERQKFGKPLIETDHTYFISDVSEFDLSSELFDYFIVHGDIASELQYKIKRLGKKDTKERMLVYADSRKIESGNIFDSDVSPNKHNKYMRVFFQQYAGEKYRLIAYLCNL